MKNLKKILFVALLLTAISIIFIAFSNYKIETFAEHKTFSKTSEIPKKRVGLILGAGKIVNGNRINLYYKYRLQAAIKLFKSGKIDYILVSGDNSKKDYDEPTDFKNDLIKNGVPESKIYLDYAGFRTLDSIVRAKEIFGLSEFTIISQKFHNERAIYLANYFGLKAIGFNAKDITGRFGYKTKVREYLARTKVFVDILFNVQPKYLGKKINII